MRWLKTVVLSVVEEGAAGPRQVRVGKMSDGRRFSYTYDANGNMIGWRRNGSSYYYLYDNTGSVVAVITSTGTVEDRYSYSPYGHQTVISSNVTNNIGFQDGIQDPTGLIKFGARYYNPATATWTQQDPTGQDPGYVFDGDDPINYSDSTGQNVCKSVFASFGLGGVCKAVVKHAKTIACVAVIGGGTVFGGEAVVTGVEGLSLLLQGGTGLADFATGVATGTAGKIGTAGAVTLIEGVAHKGCGL